MTRILLVEGHAGVASRMDESLRGRPGWEVVRAGTLLEAIRAAGESKFDAAVLETELPDGSGLDILDFLRIGSPGIRILLVADKPSESVAFHALSHGAGDFIVKDPHLETELPRRIDALLDHPEPMTALVETLTPYGTYEPQEERPLIQQAKPTANALEKALAEIVGGSVLAAGVWDLRGKPLAVNIPKDLDGDGLGFAMATLHGQIGALWTYGNLKPTGYRLVIDVEGGLLAISAIPGTYIVALLFDGGFAPRRALERVDQAGLRMLAALQGSGSGADVNGP
ncbi:MAG TPA: response regulator [Candidatus Thermoplasmatota archaeon]|nr:response regulator [Candidatus Thermoplasmatota archaeon]